MITLKGVEVSAKIKEQVLAFTASLGGDAPEAAIIRVGERPDDMAYERHAMKKIESFDMRARTCEYPGGISEADFLEAFEKINNDESVDGILLLCPLPAQIDRKKVEMMIRPEKDLDGISPVNTARIFAGEPDGFAPCTAEAVVEVLKAFDVPIRGRRAVILGRSMVVGRPLSMLLLKEDATVTICHSRTQEIEAVCREADILVAAVGRAGMVTKDFVRDGAVVIDVGINVDENGALCGDVVWDGLEERAMAATPVPGGVGAVTTAVLAKHLAMAAVRRRGRKN